MLGWDVCTDALVSVGTHSYLISWFDYIGSALCKGKRQKLRHGKTSPTQISLAQLGIYCQCSRRVDLGKKLIHSPSEKASLIHNFIINIFFSSSNNEPKICTSLSLFTLLRELLEGKSNQIGFTLKNIYFARESRREKPNIIKNLKSMLMNVKRL